MLIYCGFRVFGIWGKKKFQHIFNFNKQKNAFFNFHNFLEKWLGSKI